MSLANKVDQFYVDADVVHQIAHGDENTTVDTLGGPVPSLAKLTKDLAASFPFLGPRYMYVREEQPPGSSAGAAAQSTEVLRTLNTVVANEIPGASLFANTVTLPAGKYYLRGRSPSGGQGKIASVFGTPFVLYGNCGSNGVNTTDNETVGMVTLNVTTEICLYTKTPASGGTGLGNAKGVYVEIYGQLEIWKL